MIRTKPTSYTSFFIFLLSALVSLQCRKYDSSTPFTNEEEFKLEIPPGFPMPDFPEDNEFTLERWKLGKKLFYDPVLSVDSTISCGSCHKSELAFADNKSFSPGVMNRPGVRNAPSLANVGYHPYFLREGSVPTLEMQVAVPLQEENEFAHDILLVAEKLKYRKDYNALSQLAYQREIDPYVITRALANFERTLVSGNSPYDQYAFQGKKLAMSESALNGKALFFSSRTNCSKCHQGFNFSNYSFENNGLYQEYSDAGRMRFTGNIDDKARFKVPSLRNVEFTSPYMHDGSLKTLQEVVEHYNSGGQSHSSKSDLIKPLHLSESEKSYLIAFLKSLSDSSFINNPQFLPTQTK